MIKKVNANQARQRRHLRIRSHLAGTLVRPRLNVFRSGPHIYAQVIDDTTGQTLAAASSLEATLRDFRPAEPVTPAKESADQPAEVEQAETVEVATEAVASGAKAAKSEKSAKGSQSQKGTPAKGGKPAVAKTVLPSAQKREAKTPVEALAPIASNRKVALAREVGKLVAQRAKERGVSRVVFDRGGYAYHGRVAALAEGAREVGLSF